MGLEILELELSAKQIISLLRNEEVKVKTSSDEIVSVVAKDLTIEEMERIASEIEEIVDEDEDLDEDDDESDDDDNIDEDVEDEEDEDVEDEEEEKKPDDVEVG